MNKSTKADIVDAIYNRTRINRKDIQKVVDLFIEEIKIALISQQVIELRGFGTFEIKIRKGRRKARNPKTGEILSVDSHGIAAFRPGRELKREVWDVPALVLPVSDPSDLLDPMDSQDSSDLPDLPVPGAIDA